ncbi:hypothetical protein [Tychonema sp. BBK16]|uniref:hypothetical protein n=1 Tax=Tychonema sp. BBK16 TaxID=2699888 RepID=UPI001F3BD5C2|nr:hypothetical protein [Tychonema sp. BBK16]MCF6374789.1 hypothetical protein [Tychonema sp. BBK16]
MGTQETSDTPSSLNLCLTTGFQKIRLKEFEARLPVGDRVIMYCVLQQPFDRVN